jgi:hypothetical protein
MTDFDRTTVDTETSWTVTTCPRKTSRLAAGFDWKLGAPCLGTSSPTSLVAGGAGGTTVGGVVGGITFGGSGGVGDITAAAIARAGP